MLACDVHCCGPFSWSRFDEHIREIRIQGDSILTLINKKEASVIRERVRGVSIRKTCHNYYVEETQSVLRVLADLRQTTDVEAAKAPRKKGWRS